MTTYTIRSVKGAEIVKGKLSAAIRAAMDHGEKFEPAFGVTVEDESGTTVAEVQAGGVECDDRNSTDWWVWHDAKYTRWSGDVEEAVTRCCEWLAGESNDGPEEELPEALFTIATDGMSTEVSAKDKNEAARIYAASVDIEGIEDADDLRGWFENEGGWCKIHECYSAEAIFDYALSRVPSLGARGVFTLDEYARNSSDSDETQKHYRAAVKAARKCDADACYEALVEAARSVADNPNED